MQNNVILNMAALAGKIMLESGGEVYRVEETMTHVCRSLGAIECESYASPTAIIITITDSQGDMHTVMKRIISRRVNLSKVDAINQFSRQLTQNSYSLDETKAMLLEIEKQPAYSTKLTLLASAVAAFAFAFVFGGGLRDAFCAFLSGLLVRWCVNALMRTQLNDFLINLIGAMVAVLAGWALTFTGIGLDLGNITISTLMLLVPGLLITNAVRDIAAGDLVSGTSRSIEAFFVAIALACGTGVAHTVLVRLGGIVR